MIWCEKKTDPTTTKGTQMRGRERERECTISVLLRIRFVSVYLFIHVTPLCALNTQANTHICQMCCCAASIRKIRWYLTHTNRNMNIWQSFLGAHFSLFKSTIPMIYSALRIGRLSTEISVCVCVRLTFTHIECWPVFFLFTMPYHTVLLAMLSSLFLYIISLLLLMQVFCRINLFTFTFSNSFDMRNADTQIICTYFILVLFLYLCLCI